MRTTIVVGALFVGAFLDCSFSEERMNKTIHESSCNQAECLRCDLEAAECVKCLYIIKEDTRECLRSCPSGFDPVWSRSPTVFGRMCAEQSVLSLVSHRQVGIIAGASVLGAICVGILLGLLLLRKKGLKAPPDSPARGVPRSMHDRRPKAAEINVKGKEREEFLARLRLLRADAPYIFRMMAETRNRFKGGSGPENPFETKTKACRAVVRDLSRVLCLLGRKEEHVKTAPKDWEKLLSWTERLLARYKRQHELKELESGGVISLGVASSPTRPHGKSLFLTRQQQEEEKRRCMERTPPIEKRETVEEFLERGLDFSSDIFAIEIDDDKILDSEEPSFIPDSPPPKLALSPLNSTESLLPRSSPDAKCKRKMDLRNLNRNLWSKLTHFKDSSSSEVDLENAAGSGTSERKKSQDISGVDIPSQTFFDHIEAFVFDIEQDESDAGGHELPRIIEARSKPKKKLQSNGRRMANNILLDKRRRDSIWTRSSDTAKPNHFSSSTNKDFNETYLSKGSHLKPLQMPKKMSVGKENRTSRIRRLSSSLLRRDKKLVIPTDVNDRLGRKRRRPLTRQKQVEKEKRAAIQEKYQKSSRSDSSSSEPVVDQPQSVLEYSAEASSSGGVTPVNQVIVGQDVYFSVTKTPVLVHRPKEQMVPSRPVDVATEMRSSFSFRRHRHSSSSSSGETSSSIPSSPSSTSSPSPTSSSELIHCLNGRDNSKFNFKAKGNSDRRFEGRIAATSAPRCEILTKV